MYHAFLNYCSSTFLYISMSCLIFMKTQYLCTYRILSLHLLKVNWERMADGIRFAFVQ